MTAATVSESSIRCINALVFDPLIVDKKGELLSVGDDCGIPLGTTLWVLRALAAAMQQNG